MNLIKMAKTVSGLVYARLTWNRRDTGYVPPGIDNPRFVSARQAVELIIDNDCVINSGIASNARCSIFFWALAERFAETGGPRGLTWVVNAGQGGRGKAPGTLEELDAPGLITRFISGHLETFKSLLAAANAGRIEMHTLPQGVIAYLLEAQAEGKEYILTDVGIGTFLDPRIGNGSLVGTGRGESLVSVEGDRLRCRLPKIKVALFTAPYADPEGNIYVENIATLTETRESTLAARKNQGKVMAAVAEVKEKDEDKIFLPAEMIDAVVVNPGNEQVGGVKQRKYWPMFTEGAEEDIDESAAQVKFANSFLRITPVRTKPELAMARVAASIFTAIARPGANVNIGVGLPEEVSRLIYQGGLYKDVNFCTESGVYGGLPTAGIYFGAAINPKKLMSSAEIFHFCEHNLEVTILGFLEADSEGNINASKRGEGLLNYVGPGGFTNLVNSAKKIIFIGSWMAGANLAIKGGKLVIKKPGAHKFKDKVSQITMSGNRALQLNKQVYYITNVGAFRLTPRGMELFKVMPGLDLKRDIIAPCPMKIVLPEHGTPETIDRAMVTGDGFSLQWKSAG